MLHAVMPKHAFPPQDIEAQKRAAAHAEEGAAVEEAEEEKRSGVAVSEEEPEESSTSSPVMDTKEDTSASASATTGAAADDKPASAPTWSPNTVIMFDWDDTLLASSFLSARGYRVDCPESPATIDDAADLAQLRAQEQCVCALLKLALSYGTVNIVTNAEIGWVELSAAKFMPSVLPLLERVTDRKSVV